MNDYFIFHIIFIYFLVYNLLSMNLILIFYSRQLNFNKNNGELIEEDKFNVQPKSKPKPVVGSAEWAALRKDDMELTKVVDEKVISVSINRRNVRWSNFLHNGQSFNAIISGDSIPATVAYTGENEVYGVCYSTLAYRKNLEDGVSMICYNPSILPVGKEWLESVLNCVGRSLKQNNNSSTEKFTDVNSALDFLSCSNITYNSILKENIIQLLGYDDDEENEVKLFSSLDNESNIKILKELSMNSNVTTNSANINTTKLDSNTNNSSVPLYKADSNNYTTFIMKTNTTDLDSISNQILENDEKISDSLQNVSAHVIAPSTVTIAIALASSPPIHSLNNISNTTSGKPIIDTSNNITSISNQSQSQNKTFYEEQHQLGLFFSPTCPVCFENVPFSLQPHLLKSHKWNKREIDLFCASIPLNWKCDQCSNSKFQFGVSMNEHLRQKHRLSEKERSDAVQSYYEKWKSSKFNSFLLLFLFDLNNINKHFRNQHKHHNNNFNSHKND